MNNLLKKILTISIVIFLISIYLFVINKTSFVEYRLEGKTYRLIVARNSSDWQKGLMNYKSKKELKGADGMIFIFPDKQVRTFWNMNTYLELDVYWIKDDEVIGKDYLPSILKTGNPVTIESKGKVNKVVEIIR